MTKQEFRAIRSEYRRVCGNLYRELIPRLKDEFCMEEDTMELYEQASEALRRFASVVGCNIFRAAEILNITK